MEPSSYTWSTSAIVTLCILVVTVVLAPLGWIVHKHWVLRGNPNSTDVESNAAPPARTATQ
ncbi:hypothetical protein V8F20_004947 [Naviculisporaceae sp. PSN 640]